MHAPVALPHGGTDEALEQCFPSPDLAQPCIGMENYVVDSAVMNHRRNNVLHQQLPSLRPRMAGPGDPSLLWMANGIDTLVDNIRDNRTERGYIQTL